MSIFDAPRIPSNIVMTRNEYTARFHTKNAERLLFMFYTALRDDESDLWGENDMWVAADSNSHPEVQRMVHQHLFDNGWNPVTDSDPDDPSKTRVTVRRPNETH
jgi:hypothetical protein